MSVDATYCLINEQNPFSSVWCSHKLKSAAFKYEVGVSIKQGDIVWVSGPWPAGIPDSEVFKTRLSKYLEEDEVVEADSGYPGLEKAVTPQVATSSLQRKHKSQVRGKHENFNGRFKKFDSVFDRYRHASPTLHCKMFTCIAILTQISLKHGQKIYEVKHDYLYN